MCLFLRGITSRNPNMQNAKLRGLLESTKEELDGQSCILINNESEIGGKNTLLKKCSVTINFPICLNPIIIISPKQNIPNNAIFSSLIGAVYQI